MRFIHDRACEGIDVHAVCEHVSISRLPLTGISIRCGYRYLSHFSTAFKRFSGVTPPRISPKEHHALR
jgi:AraC-like DNA-binding protein